MSQPIKVQVTGLKDVQTAVARVDREAPNVLKNAFKEIAQETVRAAVGDVPHRTGAAARSYRPRATRRGASVAMGGPKAPYAPWLDWGGSTKVDPTGGSQGRVYRPFEPKGRYLYPNLVDNLEQIQEDVAVALNRVMAQYGLEVE